LSWSPAPGPGIGRETARQFADLGALVYCADRSEESLTETRALIAKDGGSAHAAAVDVSVESEVAGLLERISDETGRLDIAFNNAGITGGAHRVEDYPVGDFENVLRVNLTGVFLG
jgi:NAD(P)-dependent dehydrogenase (short-subunit alcohol dehydrogenase family)